jgi:S-adenosylmethionine:diacylglycerol 3-amino-3-carboxypropyl transferase
MHTHNMLMLQVDGTFVHSAWESNPYSHAFARGFFTSSCHPDYLDRSNLEAIRAIPRTELPARLTIATAPYEDAMQSRMYNKMVFSDHLDWMSDAMIREFAVKVKRQLLPGGLASFRSASLVASYAQAFVDAGLQCERVATHCGLGMDRLNSYASFYVIRQTGTAASAAVAPSSTTSTASPTATVQARV